MAKLKEKKIKTRTIWVPLDADTATQLVNEATRERRSIGSQAAIIIENYYSKQVVSSEA